MAMRRLTHNEPLPYTFARVSVMKGQLIDKGDYHKLLKMDLSSITRYLQESGYKDSITKLSTKFEGIELIDQALIRNKVRTFDKLRMISPPHVVGVIDLYLGRWDFHNLKVVLRGLYSNASKEEVEKLIVATGLLSKEHFVKLFETGSINEAIKKSKIVTEEQVGEGLDIFKNSNKLMDLENALDHFFFERAAKYSARNLEYGEEFRKFILTDIDVINMKNLLRLKRDEVSNDQIMKYMIIKGAQLNKKDLEKLAKTDSLNSLIGALKRTYYGKHIDFKEDMPLSEIELALQHYNLKLAVKKSKRNPMSISVVVSFMMQKTIEIKNLRSIVKSKHLGIDMDYVEKKLLII